MSLATERGLTDRTARLAAARSLLRIAYRAVAHSPAAPLLRLPAIQRAHRRVTATTMGTADVVEIIGLLRSAGVATWLAGGWACDALLGEQTRVHADLDLLVAEQDRGRACEVLEQHGFALAEEFDAGLMSLALELLDRRRRRKVALHLVDIAADAPGEWAVSLGERMQSLGLDSAELFATGTVAGRELPCLSPAALLALHTGYEPREEDRRDISVMCARFSLPAPPGYERALDAA